MTSPPFIYLATRLPFVILLCVLSYFFADRAIVYWAHDQHLRHFVFLDLCTKIPEPFTALLPLGCLTFLARRYLERAGDLFDALILSLILSLSISSNLCIFFKNIFGRYWPETWKNDNPSLLRDNAYGFNLFHARDHSLSFPSGHMAATVALSTVIFLLFPRLRPLCLLINILVAVGLVGMYYHFLSDVIAGAALGWMVAYSCVYYSRGKHPTPSDA